MAQDRLRVNANDVVHELVDGEVIAIDLSRGAYYSLGGGAADAWSMLVMGATGGEIAAAFDGAETTGISGEIAGLLEKLRAEMLVIPAATGTANGANGEPAAPPEFDYRPFSFEKYEDLQDYFMLDPIHEVGETGWPAPKPS